MLSVFVFYVFFRKPLPNFKFFYFVFLNISSYFITLI